MEQDQSTHSQDTHNLEQESSHKTPVFRMVFSSILGAIIGSAPGILMSLLSEKGSRMDKFSGHTMMTGSMIGAMLGHDLMRGEHAERVKLEKTKELRER